MNCKKHNFVWSPTNSSNKEKIYICINCGLQMISDRKDFIESQTPVLTIHMDIE